MEENYKKIQDYKNIALKSKKKWTLDEKSPKSESDKLILPKIDTKKPENTKVIFLRSYKNKAKGCMEKNKCHYKSRH